MGPSRATKRPGFLWKCQCGVIVKTDIDEQFLDCGSGNKLHYKPPASGRLNENETGIPGGRHPSRAEITGMRRLARLLGLMK